MITTVFNDEQCSEIIGQAKLIKLIKKGLPVILDGSSTERKQIVYRFDKYKVEFVDGTISNASGEYYVRVVDSIGRFSNKDKEEIPYLEKDKFLKVNGKEIY